MPTKEELLAYNRNNQEMCKHQSKKFKIFRYEGLYKALIGKSRNNYPQFSDHYFTGEYPIKPSDNLEDLK